KLAALLTSGWDRTDQEDALTFTSTTTPEVWTLYEFGGTTPPTYDTGSSPHMRHLLAGGGGFIGSHLTELLLARGDEVVVIDNFATGRRSNVAHLADRDRFSMIEHDIT